MEKKKVKETPYVPFPKGVFVKPTQEQQLSACGLDGLSDPRYFTPTPSFTTINTPKKGYWLDEQKEDPQPYHDFIHSKYPKLSKTARHKIYLLPLGEFDPNLSPSLPHLLAFAQAFFFGLEVELLPMLHMIKNYTDEKKLKKSDRPIVYFHGDKKKSYELNKSTVKVTVRKHDGHLQLLTSSLEGLLRQQLPDDGYCLLGLTMMDLYPQESWNYVFGEASLGLRVGVFSFARYTPLFDYPDRETPILSQAEQGLLLLRSCAVMVHETVHMFGIAHCQYYNCIMNGANCLEESDEQPLALCPICLHKLFHIIQFDILQRYLALRKFYKKSFEYEELGFEREYKWIERRLQELGGNGSGGSKEKKKENKTKR